jgi:hypothetical protein
MGSGPGSRNSGRLDGRDYLIEPHWGDDSRERLDPLVADMLRTRPDLIVTQGPIVYNVQRSKTRDSGLVRIQWRTR